MIKTARPHMLENNTRTDTYALWRRGRVRCTGPGSPVTRRRSDHGSPVDGGIDSSDGGADGGPESAQRRPAAALGRGGHDALAVVLYGGLGAWQMTQNAGSGLLRAAAPQLTGSCAGPWQASAMRGRRSRGVRVSAPLAISDFQGRGAGGAGEREAAACNGSGVRRRRRC